MASIASPALALQTAPPPSSDIVVTGSKVKSREVEKVARAVTPPGDLYREPLAQFQEPVCPGILGMSAEFSDVMDMRIRSVAERARIRVAKPGKCRVNLLVIFVPNGQLAMQNLSHKGPWLFGNLSPSALGDLATDPELKDLAADPGPVHAWVNSEIRSREGNPLTGRGDPDEPALTKTSGGHSHMFMYARRDIVGSVIVIDTDAVVGKTVSQIADYAAMRGLARTRPPGTEAKIETILSLFDGGATPPPEEITRFDLAYLRAVYGAVPNIAGITKLGLVAQEMKKSARDE
jgi:hypothetical protein